MTSRSPARPPHQPPDNAPVPASRAERTALWLGMAVQAVALAALLGLGLMALLLLAGRDVLFRYQGF